MSSPLSCIAGLSLKGGRHENFYISLLQNFKGDERVFLKSLYYVKDEELLSKGDLGLKLWINEYQVEDIVVDFPLSMPICNDCNLDCPGSERCPNGEVAIVRAQIEEALFKDNQLFSKDPKDYERKRVENKLEMSRSYKRRLKKGFIPYWNRPIDLYIWQHYYDDLLDVFGTSYDSFGTSSTMLLFKFNYLKRHLPLSLNMMESNVLIFLLEMMREGLISKFKLKEFIDMELGANARIEILEAIQKRFDVFFYDDDEDLLIKDLRAFQSFILSLIGYLVKNKHEIQLPDWTLLSDGRFILASSK